MDLKSTLSEESCNAGVLHSLSWKSIGSAAEGCGQQTGQERTETARLGAKWLPAFSKINYKDDSEGKEIESSYHCS